VGGGKRVRGVGEWLGWEAKGEGGRGGKWGMDVGAWGRVTKEAGQGRGVVQEGRKGEEGDQGKG